MTNTAQMASVGPRVYHPLRNIYSQSIYVLDSRNDKYFPDGISRSMCLPSIKEHL